MSYTKKIAAPTFSHHESPAGDCYQVLVLGCARGGTSMVAGVVSQLGISIGSSLDPDNLEDSDFLGHAGDRTIFSDPARTIECEEFIAKIVDVIATRNRDHRRWAWKDPLSILYAHRVRAKLPNLRVIAIMRDVAAISQREYLESEAKGAKMTPSNFIDDACVALDHYSAIFEFCRDSVAPTLFVSYERAIRHPADFVRAVSKFLNVSPTKEDISTICSYISSDRLTGAIGASRRITDSSGDDYFERLIRARLTARTKPIYKKKLHQFSAISRTDCYHEVVTLFNSGKYGQAETLAVLFAGTLVTPAFEVTQLLDLIKLGVNPVVNGINVEDDVRDIISGCFYIAGMSALLTFDYRVASVYLCAAAGLAELSVASPAPGAIPQSIVVSALFHYAVAVKQNGDNVRSQIARWRTISIATALLSQKMDTDTHRILQEFIVRANTELA